MNFDLAVIGAGPAGAAAALCAARAGLSVALFEPQPASDKPCGEGILPSGVAALRTLGLAGLLERAQALRHIRYVLASGRELGVALPAPGLALERPLLSAALARAIAGERSITLFRRRVTSRRLARGFLLESGERAWSARTLIAADGLAGQGAAWLRGGARSPQRYGLRARAEARLPLEHVEVHLGRSCEVYLTPLGERRINVAVLRSGLPSGERTSHAWLTAALREHPRAAGVLGDWVTPPEARALTGSRPRCAAAEGAFLAGDAAGGVDPVLGCGVAIALGTGLSAARAACRVLACGSGVPERAHARFVRRETELRRAVATGLLFLARHPRAQELVARGLEAWPALGSMLAAKVARASEDRTDTADARRSSIAQA
jgi:flavin-dependent dehydrogenase